MPLPGLRTTGIGLPAVAGSGMMAANTLASLQKHMRMLDKFAS